MAFNMDTITLPTAPVDTPRSEVKRGRDRKPSPFDAWFEAGPLPEGKSYPLDVPSDPNKFTEARKAIVAELLRAQMHYNGKDGVEQPLGYRTAVANGKLYVSIVHRAVRKPRETEDAKSVEPVAETEVPTRSKRSAVKGKDAQVAA